MAGQKSTVVMLAALLLFAGCRKDLSEGQASVVLKDLAVELTKFEGSQPDRKMQAVRETCARHGIEVESLAAYLKDNPGADSVLAGHMAAKFGEQIEDQKREIQKKLDQVRAEGARAGDEVREASARKEKELEAAARTEIEKLKADFEKREKELLKAIVEVRASQ